MHVNICIYMYMYTVDNVVDQDYFVLKVLKIKPV